MNEFEIKYLLDGLFGLFGAIGIWVLKMTWAEIRKVQDSGEELAKKVNDIEVMVAREYVTREEISKLGNAIFKKLDKIEDKIDGKADKVGAQ